MEFFQNNNYHEIISTFKITKRTLNEQIELRIKEVKKKFLEKTAIPYQDIRNFINDKCKERYLNFICKLLEAKFNITFTTLQEELMSLHLLLNIDKKIDELLSINKKNITIFDFTYNAEIIKTTQNGITIQILPFVCFEIY